MTPDSPIDEAPLSTTPDALAFTLRSGVTTDHPYVVETWLQAYRGQSIARDAGPGYVHDMKWLIRQLIGRAALLIACDPEEHGAIWGWAVTSGSRIHYVYVREKLRRQGIARSLVSPYLAHGAPVTFCARTSEDIRVPAHWHYSFLAGLRTLLES